MTKYNFVRSVSILPVCMLSSVIHNSVCCQMLEVRRLHLNFRDLTSYSFLKKRVLSTHLSFSAFPSYSSNGTLLGFPRAVRVSQACTQTGIHDLT